MNREKKDILNQLKNSGPGFTVPEGYFESYGDRQDVSVFDQIGDDPGFKTPEQYFDTFDAKVMERSKPKVIQLKSKHTLGRLLGLSIAASILLFFGIQYMQNDLNGQDQLSIQEGDIANWIDSGMVSFDTYEIAEAFGDTEFDYSLYTKDEIDDYLMDDYLNDVAIENLILEN